MCAHIQGQTVNYSKLGASLDMSDNTVRNYLDLLSGSFVIRILQPYFSNLKKRLIKAPKVYIRDTGILHALLGIESTETLFGHPCFGSSWEGMVIENVIAACKMSISALYYRTAQGEEADLVLEYDGKRVIIACKTSLSPTVTHSLKTAIADVQPVHTFIVSPVTQAYPLTSDITVCPLDGLLKEDWLSGFLA